MKKICVVGACNLDLVGRCYENFRSGDASEGELRIQHGGVGRNLAKGLSGAGVDVDFISVLGEDFLGKEVEEELLRENFVFYKISRERSDLFIGLEEQDGELYGALADMRSIESLGFSELPFSVLKSADALVLDCCLSEDLLAELCHYFQDRRIYVDGVSIDRVGRILPSLCRVHLLKLNQMEACQLTGKEDCYEAVSSLLDQGVGSVLLSLGKEGVLHGSRDGFLRKQREAKVTYSSLGAGDALFSGFISGEMEGLSLEQSLERALDFALNIIERDL